jgi:hypothetical protein
MKELLKLFGELIKLFNVYQLLFVASMLLLLLGFLEPKRFLGIEIDWEPKKKGEVPKAIFPILAGWILLAFSVWHLWSG